MSVSLTFLITQRIKPYPNSKVTSYSRKEMVKMSPNANTDRKVQHETTKKNL